MKEFFLPLTEPVGAVWGFMLVGCLWLLIRKQWRGAVWLGVPTVALFVLGSTTLIEGLVEKEEQQWEDHSLWNLVQRPDLQRKTKDYRPLTTDYGLQTTDQKGKDYETTDHRPLTTDQSGKDYGTTGLRDHETGEKKTTDNRPRATERGEQNQVVDGGTVNDAAGKEETTDNGLQTTDYRTGEKTTDYRPLTADQKGKDYGTTGPQDYGTSEKTDDKRLQTTDYRPLTTDQSGKDQGTAEKGTDHGTTGPQDYRTGEKTTDYRPLTADQKGKDYGTTGPQDYGTSEKTDDKRPPTTDYKPRTTDYGLQTTDNGPRTGNQRLVFSGRKGDVADVVVVLGGGTRMSRFDGYQFAPVDAFSRVLTGIELVRAGRAKILILGGSYPRPGKPQEPGMVAIQDWVQAWGLCRVDGVSTRLNQASGQRVAPSPLVGERVASVGETKSRSNGLLSPALSYPGGRPPGGEGGAQGQSGFVGCGVTNLGICLNTHDEALAFKRMKQFQDWNSVMLVTSALHMKRSVALFKKLGIKVEPVASDFEVFGVSQDLPFSIFPRQHRFRLWGLWLHEKIGMMVYRHREWI